jgi:cell wall-associated protease
MKALALLLFMFSTSSQAARFVVETKHKINIDSLKLKGIKSVELLADIDHPYFSRLYIVSGDVTRDSLMQYTWVEQVEETPQLSRLSLLPSPNPKKLVNDELFSYQWALLNQDQVFLKEKDDIHNLPMKGVRGHDIGWGQILKLAPERRPIVAVLDSGVDLEHPELKNNLWKNVNECGKNPAIDNDNNKLPGDCHGWNFTAAIDSDSAKWPQDTDGHGTHVAGIIAAANNDWGIVGVNPNALIMPIKVLGDNKSEIASSEAFARGIIYATDNGADVINMSLGWPRALETKFLREAVSYALSQGVIVVAAAGNNNSAEPLFPCAYDGVICVAASTLDGSVAGFSNYGGHVDTIAPGEAILGLYPTIFEPELFAVPGFEIKSGTSQSAPMVAGMVSILRAQNKDITIEEVLGRFYKASPGIDQKKYVLGGNANWSNLSLAVETPIVRPVLKRVRQLILNGTHREARLLVPFRNFGLTAKEVIVKVESMTNGLEVLTGDITLNNIEHGQTIDVALQVKINDLTTESNVLLKFTVKSSEGQREFFNEIPVSRDIRNEVEFKKIPFVFKHTPLPLGGIRNGVINSFVSTVEGYGKTRKHELLLRRQLREEKKLELTLFRRQQESFVEVPRVILISNAIALMNFIRIDLNMDGREDYVVQTVVEDDQGKHLVFSFYDEHLNDLWPEYQHVKLSVDVAVASLSELRFLRYRDHKLGNILVPAFFTNGQIPKIDQVADFHGKYNMSRENRLYYLQPLWGEKEMRLRTLLTPQFKEELKKELKAHWFDTVEFENILPVTTLDAINGQLRVIFTVGFNNKRRVIISSFTANSSTQGAALSQLVLQTEDVDPLYSIGADGFDIIGDTYLNIYDRHRAKLVSTKQLELTHQYVYRHDNEADLIAGHIASFTNGSDRFSVIQTRDELVSVSHIGRNIIKTKRPKLRYSFLSGKLLSEMYYPVIYRRQGHQAPALYVDATAVTANRVYLFEEQQGHLVSSIKNSLIVPANCRAINPHFSPLSMSHEFTFLCLEEKEWVLRVIPMQ